MGSVWSKSSSHRVRISEIELLASEWNVEQKQIDAARDLLTQDKVSVTSPLRLEDKMKIFCYVKRILPSDNTLRKIVLREIFNNADPAIFERLKRIVQTGEDSSNTAPAFEQFIESHPEWEHKSAWVLFRDHPKLQGKNSYVERTQKSGLCYLHAPIIFQHYLLAMESKDPIPMIDLAQFLRCFMDAAQLKKHIFENYGGYSIDALRMFLGLENQHSLPKIDICSQDVPRLLHSYGPGLISSMEVWSCFADQKVWQHLDSPTGKMRGLHSVVLVGYRQVDGEVRYLIQNTWENMLFKEVSPHYLRSCGAILTFCDRTDLNRPIHFGTNYHTHVETSVDCCELPPPETVVPLFSRN
jgi:hypothetical protein